MGRPPHITMNMIKCSTCKQEKNLTEFHRNKNMPSGHSYTCKACVKIYKVEYLKRPEAREKHYKRCKKYMKTKKGLEAQRRYQRSEKGKLAAVKHRKTAGYKKLRISRNKKNILSGKSKIQKMAQRKLVKKPCEKCGTTKMIHGHHEDYSKPLEVVWLCPLHHAMRHKEIRLEKMVTS